MSCKRFSLTEIIPVWFLQSQTNRPRRDCISASSSMYTRYSDYNWPCDIFQKTVTLNMYLILQIFAFKLCYIYSQMQSVARLCKKLRYYCACKRTL